MGLYELQHQDCDVDELTGGCYDYAWLLTEAEPSTEFVFDLDGEPFLPNALVNAIRINAGISEEDWSAATAELLSQNEEQLQITYS